MIHKMKKISSIYFLYLIVLVLFGPDPAYFTQGADNHPCLRECSPDPSSFRTCGYNFTIENFWILSKACYECPNVTSDCQRLDCIPGDGVKRGISVVNRLLPGPSIRVCEGDRVLVNVQNLLYGEGASIHWHGIHQKTTPWYDGVPGVTQCPIPPGSTFRYDFETTSAGTYFWHSHTGFQRGDGVFGSLIIRKSKNLEPHGELYDFDLPEHEMIILDWLANLSLSVFLNHHHSDGDNKPQGMLVNGKGFPLGFFNDFDSNQTMEDFQKPFAPIYEVRVKKGYSYRLRVISNGALNCPIKISIEEHELIIIASDGSDIEPVTVQSLVIYAGERWDIVLKANKPIGSYWIKFQGLMDCDDRFTSVYQLAVLNYDSVPNGTLPKYPIKTWQGAGTEKLSGIELNPLNEASKIKNEPLKSSVNNLRSFKDDDPEIITKIVPDHQFYLSYDFNPIDNIRFHGPHIPIRTVRKGLKLYSPQLNHISNSMPESPILTMREALRSTNFCTEESMQKNGINCTVEYCECTHLLRVKLNSIVEVILVDRGYTFNANHPFHLHGHDFRVVAMEKLGNDTEPWKVKELDKLGLIERQRKQAVIKDTVTVPDGGYTIIRFRANNPGFWFFHCHLTFHVEIGMGLIFQVGEHSDFLKPPKNFPKCGSFITNAAKSPIYYDTQQSFLTLENQHGLMQPINYTYESEDTTEDLKNETYENISSQSNLKSSSSFSTFSQNKLEILGLNAISFSLVYIYKANNKL